MKVHTKSFCHVIFEVFLKLLLFKIKQFFLTKSGIKKCREEYLTDNLIKGLYISVPTYKLLNFFKSL